MKSVSAEQISIFDLDLQFGKTSPEPSVQTLAKTSGRSLKKRQKSQIKPLQFLNLQKNGIKNISDGNISGLLQEPLWETVGALPGVSWMLNSGESPSVAAESSLSQILEDNPHPKYYLSAKACQGILRRAEKRGKELPPMLKEALIRQASCMSLIQTTAESQALVKSPQQSAVDSGRGGNNTPLVQCIEPGALSRGQGERIWDKAPTLRAVMGDNHPCVIGVDVYNFTETGDTAATLNASSGNSPTHSGPSVMQNTYCIQGNCIDRADTAGCNGKGWTEDVCYTLNTINRPAIVRKIDCSPEGISGTVSSKWAKGTGGPSGDEHYNLITQKRFGEYESGRGTLTANTGHAKTGETLVIAGLDCRNSKENGNISGTIQKNGNSLNAIHPVRVGYSVRRLTPLECERLQDYPDGWTDISWVIKKQKKNGKESVHSYRSTDSARYKACGNSVAVVCPEYVLEGIKEVIERGQIS
jgi:hypothetical protein